jgi:hypothetical protein
MSVQNISSIPEGPNPLAWLRNITKGAVKSPREQRDEIQGMHIDHAMAMGAVNYEATKRHTAQQARLTEKAEQGKHERAIHFANTIHGFSQPGAQVSIAHGNISAKYTSKMPTPTTGRVPVKKNRGGKSPK